MGVIAFDFACRMKKQYDENTFENYLNLVWGNMRTDGRLWLSGLWMCFWRLFAYNCHSQKGNAFDIYQYKRKAQQSWAFLRARISRKKSGQRAILLCAEYGDI
jgi:hypothetical protein